MYQWKQMSTPQSSLFFENFCQTSHSIERDMEQQSHVPYLSVVSNSIWRPLNCDPQNSTPMLPDEPLKPTIVEDLKAVAMSPLNIDLSVREEFDNNGITTDFNTNEPNFKGWTPWTPTVFGPSLIGIVTSNTCSTQAIYPAPQNTPICNQSFSFNSLPSRNNSMTVAFNESSTYSFVVSRDPVSLGSQAADPNPMQSLPLPYLYQSRKFCQFCKNNGREYRNHILKTQDGRVVCPLLRAYNCPLCNNGGGDYAHTVRYCPHNKPHFWRSNV